MNLKSRPRRNRLTESTRALVCETRLHRSNFIQPLFIIEGKNISEPIRSMPGQSRLSVDLCIKLCREIYQAGIPGVAIFPVIGNLKKDKLASEGINPKGFLSEAIRAIKVAVPQLMLITDVAMDPFSIDGHDGYVNSKGEIENDKSVEILVQMAIVQAEAGCDWVAPSDMMDGRVGAIRAGLDSAGFENVSILSYSAKYASSFYGPFREALDSAPRAGDKKTYQMDPANRREAMREALLDISEGADAIMVKPAMPYLDIISDLKAKSKIPIAAYQVSGEYAMLKAAGEKGWLDANAAMNESLLSIKRAGADIILSYAALEWARAHQ
jgi:porphobilinogen synthase